VDSPLQRGVNCEPDFYPGLGSRGRERLRRLTGYKPDEKVRQSTDDLSSVAYRGRSVSREGKILTL
jgi:hypothetical protein